MGLVGARFKSKPKRFASAVRLARERLNLPQMEITRRLGTSPSYIPMLEAAERGIDLDEIPRLATALEINRSQLLKLYLYETSPVAYATLFGDEMPELIPANERHSFASEDLLARLRALPEDLQGPLAYIIEVLFQRLVA